MSTAHTFVKVTLRERLYEKTGHIALYLDYYPPIRNSKTMKQTRREYLGLYLYAKPTCDALVAYNKEIREKALAICCMRQTAIINEEFGFMDHNKKKMDFLPYFKEHSDKKGDKWTSVYKHFYNFCGGKCTFGDLTVEFCQKFQLYLVDAAPLKRPNEKMCKNSVAAFWATFRAMLKKAYHDKYIRENINDYLDALKKEDVHKEYLTQEEVIKLANTPCEHPVLKQASLFSCLTGLRISDILKLRWEDIQLAPDEGFCEGFCLRFTSQKTDRDVTIPIGFQAYELLGERGSGIVFKGLKRCWTQGPLKKWIAEAGIKNKHITFHCFRHTYATLQIAAGTDIYTVSKMLTHKSVSTTQIYADLVSEKKRATVDKITLK